MKLFDGTENYELISYQLRVDKFKTPILYLNLSKNTNVTEGVSDDGLKVINHGPKYDTPDVNDSSVILYAKAMGTFVIHPTSVIENTRLKCFYELTKVYSRAEMFVSVDLGGDNVLNDTSLHEFKLEFTAKTGQWSTELQERKV